MWYDVAALLEDQDLNPELEIEIQMVELKFRRSRSKSRIRKNHLKKKKNRIRQKSGNQNKVTKPNINFILKSKHFFFTRDGSANKKSQNIIYISNFQV